MALMQQVMGDLKAAMKARDKGRMAALRLIRAALLEHDKSGSPQGDELDVLRRMRKQRLEAIEAYEQGGRVELAETERAEMAVIDSYLPALADEATTEAWVREAIGEAGASSRRDLGRVMGQLMRAHKGEVDAQRARELVERLLD